MLDNELLEELFIKYIGYKLDYKECDICKLYLPDKCFINFECNHRACFNCCMQLNTYKCHLCRTFLSDLKGILGSNNRIIIYNKKLSDKNIVNNKFLEAIKYLKVGLDHGCTSNFYTIGICYMSLKKVKECVEYFLKFLLTLPLIVKSSDLDKNLNDYIFVAYVTICSYIHDYKKDDSDLTNIIKKSKFYLGINYISNYKNELIKVNLTDILNDELVNNSLFKYFYLIGSNSKNTQEKIVNYFYIYLLDNINYEIIILEVLEFLIDNYNFFKIIDFTKDLSFFIENDNLYKKDLITIMNKKDIIFLNDLYNILNKNNKFDNKFNSNCKYSSKFSGRLLLLYHYIILTSNLGNKKFNKYLDLFLSEICDNFSKENGSIYPVYLDYVLNLINKNLGKEDLENLEVYKKKILKRIIQNCIKESGGEIDSLLLSKNKIENKKRKINHI